MSLAAVGVLSKKCATVQSVTGGLSGIVQTQAISGIKVALLFVLFHQRLCGPLANSLFHHRPDANFQPDSKLETAVHKADNSIRKVIEIELLEAA